MILDLSGPCPGYMCYQQWSGGLSKAAPGEAQAKLGVGLQKSFLFLFFDEPLSCVDYCTFNG